MKHLLSFALLFISLLISAQDKTQEFQIGENEQLLGDVKSFGPDGFIFDIGTDDKEISDQNCTLYHYSPEMKLIRKVALSSIDLTNSYYHKAIVSKGGEYVYLLNTKNEEIAQIRKDGNSETKKFELISEKWENYGTSTYENDLIIISRDENDKICLDKINHADLSHEKSTISFPSLESHKTIAPTTFIGTYNDQLYFKYGILHKKKNETLQQRIELGIWVFNMEGTLVNSFSFKPIIEGSESTMLYTSSFYNGRKVDFSLKSKDTYVTSSSSVTYNPTGAPTFTPERSITTFTTHTKGIYPDYLKPKNNPFSYGNTLLDESTGELYYFGISKTENDYRSTYFCKKFDAQGKELWTTTKKATSMVLKSRGFKRVSDYSFTVVSFLLSDDEENIIYHIKNNYNDEFEININKENGEWGKEVQTRSKKIGASKFNQYHKDRKIGILRRRTPINLYTYTYKNHGVLVEEFRQYSRITLKYIQD